MWYVVGADKGARLLSGLTQEITPEEYEERVRDNSIMEVLARYDVRKGDVFFLPAGRIHAIGAGAFVAEIQQTSDITYRIYDYGRLGLDGKPRQLHIEQAKEAIDYRVFPDYRTTSSTPLSSSFAWKEEAPWWIPNPTALSITFPFARARPSWFRLRRGDSPWSLTVR